MKAPLVATLICLCGAACAATRDTATHAPPPVPEPAQGAVMVAAVSPPPSHSPASRPPEEPRHNERDLLLAGVALMAAIALRRTGADQ